MNIRAFQATAAGGVLAVLTVVGLAAFWGRDESPAAVSAAEPPVLEGGTPIVPGEGEYRAPRTLEHTSAPTIMIEIQGAIASPGSYSFSQGARVDDALHEAGGVLEQADIVDLNIAAVLIDGSVLTVPYRRGNPRQIAPGAADFNAPAYTRSGWSGNGQTQAPAGLGPAVDAAGGKIDLNTATQAELESLPGVGEKTAEKIIRFRETQRFTQVEDLRYIQGIGDKRLETLRPHVIVK